jgi:hypothetical protein
LVVKVVLFRENTLEVPEGTTSKRIYYLATHSAGEVKAKKRPFRIYRKGLLLIDLFSVFIVEVIL